MIKLILFLGVFLCGCSCMSLRAESSKRMTLTSPDGNKKVYLEHASKSDLEGSASGYIYQSDGKGPATLVHLGESHYAEPHEFSQFVNQGYHSFAEPVKFEPYRFDNFGGAHGFGGGHHLGGLDFGGGHYFGGGDFGGKGNFYGGNKGYFVGGGGGYGGEEGGKYQHQKGHQANEEYYHGGGENGGKGFKDREEFNKALLKKLHDSEEEGYNKHAGGSQKNQYEKDEKFHDVKQEKKGEEGENFSAKKSHKKGHKTTGFHNVYHKDEYKKNHSFFDESDDGGHHAEFGANHEAHGAEGGGFSKEGHLNSDHHSGEFLKKGGFQRGDFESAAKGYNESEGGKKYYSDGDEYGKKGSKHFQKEFGYKGHSGEHSGEY